MSKRPATLLLALAGFLVFGSMACGKDPMVPATGLTIPAEQISDDPTGLVVRVEVSDTEIATGERTSIKVVVENPTDRNIVLGFSSGCYIMFAVTTAEGVPVAPRYIACTTEAPIVTFAAGTTVAREFWWASRESIDDYGDALPPGEYLVVGGLSEYAEVARSEPVAIRVVEP